MAGDALPAPDATCDGGDLDCGSGLLLMIRAAMATLAAGGHLLVRSRESSVREDLPAWCRMVGHELLDATAASGGYTDYLLRKKHDDPALAGDLQQAREHVWQTRVRWAGAMQAKAAVRNHDVAVGQPASFDTDDAAPSAIELLLVAIGGALNTGLAWRLSRMGIDVPHLEVVVKARLVDSLAFLGVDAAAGGAGARRGRPGLERVDVAIYTDAVCEAGVLDATLRETVDRCPVTQSLLRGTPVTTQLRTL